MKIKFCIYFLVLIFSFSNIMAKEDAKIRNLDNLSEVLSNIAGQVNSQRTVQDSNKVDISENRSKINEILTAATNAADAAAFLIALQAIDPIE